ncbi:MAG: hypothetical protein IKU09_05615, partial [Firmicutes bacterium]|nr:hypothetical protein [Bacillota bacterium]
HHYSAKHVRDMIQCQKERYGWEFLFLGANIDAVREAAKFGIDEACAVDYHCDSAGTELNYEVLSAAVSQVRSSSAGKKLDRSWKARIEEDYAERK